MQRTWVLAALLVALSSCSASSSNSSPSSPPHALPSADAHGLLPSGCDYLTMSEASAVLQSPTVSKAKPEDFTDGTQAQPTEIGRNCDYQRADGKVGLYVAVAWEPDAETARKGVTGEDADNHPYDGFTMSDLTVGDSSRMYTKQVAAGELGAGEPAGEYVIALAAKGQHQFAVKCLAPKDELACQSILTKIVALVP